MRSYDIINLNAFKGTSKANITDENGLLTEYYFIDGREVSEQEFKHFETNYHEDDFDGHNFVD